MMLGRIVLPHVGRIGLALTLMLFSAVGSSGFMDCFSRMSAKPIVVEKAPIVEDCCAAEAAKLAAPKPAPEPTAEKCCCLDAMEKSVVEVNQSNPIAFQFDFPIILEPKPEFSVDTPVITIEQVRWPEVHGPPGIVPPTYSPRAPPVA